MSTSYWSLTLVEGKTERRMVYQTYGEVLRGVRSAATDRGLRIGYQCPAGGYMLDRDGARACQFLIRKHDRPEYVVMALDSGQTAMAYDLGQFAVRAGLVVDGSTLRDPLTGAAMYATVTA